MNSKWGTRNGIFWPKQTNKRKKKKGNKGERFVYNAMVLHLVWQKKKREDKLDNAVEFHRFQHMNPSLSLFILKKEKRKNRLVGESN